MLNDHLKTLKGVKFTGADLAIVIGDVLYAMALQAFLAIKEETQNKEKALGKLIETTIYTGCGEFIELLYGAKSIDEIKKEDIYKIYDLKTANYTFASPLTIGATLAGADKSEVQRLFQYGLYLGRAFQIQDDILGIFGEEKEIGKSSLTDLQESKKTILIWHAYAHSPAKDRSKIKRILSKNNVSNDDLSRMRKLISGAGALDYANREIDTLIKEANRLNKYSSMKKIYKNALEQFSKEMLSL
jgi:geranylgeranyl diphosphate synthase type I